MKLSLKGRQIPRNKEGDPAFGFLSREDVTDTILRPTLLEVFTREEIVELVNRSLYQLEYQTRAHAKYREERQNLERPIREMFHSLFPRESWAKATQEQLSECMTKLKEGK